LATRKPFLLRIDERTFEALRRWADEDLRSVNGQVEFLLRRALADAGRLPGQKPKGQKPKRPSTSPDPLTAPGTTMGKEPDT